MIDEGYIKYQIHWTEAPPLSLDLSELIRTRNLLYKRGWIGEYPDLGIGFGNVSQRCPGGFVVSGTQTGHLPQLTEKHFSLVNRYDLDQNELWCSGPVKASSEALTHAAIYACDPSIQAVLHIHHKAWWNHLLHRVPTTSADVPYGTPEMAREVTRLFGSEGLAQAKILAMAGHEEGILSFGSSTAEALQRLDESFRGFFS